MIMNKQYKIVVTLAIVCFSLLSFGQFKDQKTIEKSSAFSQTGRVSVNNKHGNIEVVSWNKDSIRVQVKITGESKSLAKLNEAMAKTSAQISLKFSNAEINTLLLESAISKGITDIKELAGSSNVIKINYTIYLPKGAKVRIANKYGDVLFNDHNGDIEIDISHGNLRANSLPNLTKLYSNFGNVYLVSSGSFRARLHFSELDIETAEHLTLDSKGSSFELGHIDEITITSTNDNINIDEVNHLNFIGNLSKVKIATLGISSSINMKYGKFRIRKIQSTVCKFSVHATRTTVDLGFAPNVHFQANGMQEDLEIISANPNAHIVTDGFTVSGYYGTNPDATCVYTINGQKSKIYFR
jgi:hypothetical protein